MKSAKQVHYSKITVIHGDSERVAIAELKIWEVPKNAHYQEGRKYSLFLVWRDSGAVILGIDNHKPKGPHLHYDNRESVFEYFDDKALVDDFWKRVKNEGFLI